MSDLELNVCQMESDASTWDIVVDMDLRVICLIMKSRKDKGVDI